MTTNIYDLERRKLQEALSSTYVNLFELRKEFLRVKGFTTWKLWANSIIANSRDSERDALRARYKLLSNRSNVSDIFVDFLNADGFTL